MAEPNRVVPIQIAGTRALVRIRQPRSSEEEVTWLDYDLDDVVDAIKAMAGRLGTVFVALEPTKASIEFSVDLSVEAGKLVALFFEGGGSAGLKVSLEWDRTRGAVGADAEG